MPEPRPKKSSVYDRFYAGGGWKYSSWRERRFLSKRIVEPLSLRPGTKLLEIGCGRGFHSNLFATLGFDVVGVDLSPVGVDAAKAAFTRPRFFNTDAADLEGEFGRESFDVIYARGMSWYHYELNGVNEKGVDVPARTAGLFRLLGNGGVFVLQIITDFSGGRAETGVHYNEYENYLNLFRPFGEVVLVSDWKGKPLHSDADARKSGRNVIIATRKR